MRLAEKLGSVFIALSVTVLAGVMAVIYVTERGHLAQQARESLRHAAVGLARVCAESLASNDELTRLGYLRTLIASRELGEILFAAFVVPEAGVLMHSDFLKGDLTLLHQRLPEGFHRRALEVQHESVEDVRSSSPPARVAYAPVRIRERRVGVVLIAFDLEGMDRSVDRLRHHTMRRLSWAALAGATLSVLLAMIVAPGLLRPVHALQSGVRRIGEGKFDSQVPVNSSDEIGELGRDFNAMARRLAELDEMKDAFLAQMTHDLRNPLGAIMGCVDLLRGENSGPLNDKQRKWLAAVAKGAEHLNGLITNMLDIAKLEAGRMPISPRTVDVEAYAGSVIEMFRAKAQQFGVSLDGSGIPVGAQVYADEEALTRILTNLVSNALKFTPAGGRVSVEWTSAGGKGDRIAVRDSGIGIPPERLGEVFKKFSQIQETRNKVRPSQGSGLGLAICRELVTAHGGSIWVESQYQRGTTFYFTLPAPPRDAGSQRGLRPQPKSYEL